MRVRKTWAVAAVLGIALLWASLPVAAVPSEDSGIVRLEISVSWTDPPQYWWGRASGDISGMVKYEANPEETPWWGGMSPAGHFYEVFTICPGFSGDPEACTTESASYITGVDQGVYLWMTGSGKWHFMAYGSVIDASPDFAYLIGYAYHENGWTTDPNLGPPIAGSASALMAPS